MTNETPALTSPTCAECDHECRMIDSDEQCCLCADDRVPCSKCDNRLEAQYEHATTPAYGNGDH